MSKKILCSVAVVSLLGVTSMVFANEDNKTNENSSQNSVRVENVLEPVEREEGWVEVNEAVEVDYEDIQKQLQEQGYDINDSISFEIDENGVVTNGSEIEVFESEVPLEDIHENVSVAQEMTDADYEKLQEYLSELGYDQNEAISFEINENGEMSFINFE